jgi:hypothetical protein
MIERGWPVKNQQSALLKINSQGAKKSKTGLLIHGLFRQFILNLDINLNRQIC